MAAASGFIEVGGGVFVARYPQWDVSIGLVVGAQSALVVDTRAGVRQAREVIADAAHVTSLPVRHVVNTHVHFDHTFGNAAFPDAAIHAHENAAAGFEQSARAIRVAMRAETEGSEEYGYTIDDLHEAIQTPLRAPDHVFGHGHELDLGDRVVQLRFGGRGHTDGDIAIRVPDAHVTFIGDLVEESGPPSYGDDCWPLDWPLTLGWHLSQLDTASVIVPGHGRPVDEAFVRAQHEQLDAVADVLRERLGSGMPLATALRTPDDRLPWPLQTLATAMSRAWQAWPEPPRR